MSIRQKLKWVSLALAGVGLSGCVAPPPAGYQPVTYSDGYAQPTYVDGSYVEPAPVYYEGSTYDSYYVDNSYDPYYVPTYPVASTSIYYNVYKDRHRSHRHADRRAERRADRRAERRAERRRNLTPEERAARRNLTPEERAERRALRRENRAERRANRVERRQQRAAAPRRVIPVGGSSQNVEDRRDGLSARPATATTEELLLLKRNGLTGRSSD